METVESSSKSNIAQYILIGIIILCLIVYGIYTYYMQKNKDVSNKVEEFVNNSTIDNHQTDNKSTDSQSNNQSNNQSNTQSNNQSNSPSNSPSTDNQADDNQSNDDNDNNTNKLYSTNDSLPSDTELLDQYNLSVNEIENIKNKLNYVE